MARADDVALRETAERAVRVFAEETRELDARTAIASGTHACADLVGDRTAYTLTIPARGLYALFLEHPPEELGVRILVNGEVQRPAMERGWAAGHTHEEEVSSVGLTSDRSMDLRKMNAWLTDLLKDKGPDLYRTKGIVAVQGMQRRYVFQGVHMLLDGREDQPWKPNEKRVTQMVFIGKHLDRAALEAGFASCLS